MKKISRKKLFIYGISGIGPNLLNLMVGSYLCDALMTEGFSENIENWTYLNKTLVIIGLWSILVTVAKLIDGLIDIPFGSFSDNLKTRFGNRRPSLLLGNIVMLLAYFMMLIVPRPDGANLFNTIWFGVWLAVFYAFYTLTMVTFYATFSEITDNESDRIFLSNVKSGVDIIYFVLGYAAIPGLIGLANIRLLAIIVLIFMPSMLIPFFLIKEHSTLDKDKEIYEKEEKPVEKLNMFKALKHTLKNKDFIIWMIIYGALQFGLSMYLTGFNVYYSGTMKYDGLQTMLCNVAAFGPVCFTLILYNYIIKKKGFRFGFQYSLIMFTTGMILATLCRPQIFPNINTRLVFSIIACLICSFGIGSFFSVSYTIPSQIAADEKENKGLSYPAMYFAVQGLFEAIVSAISTGIIWINFKKIEPSSSFFFNPGGGTGLLTFVVACGCILSFSLSFFLPKSLTNLGKKKGE